MSIETLSERLAELRNAAGLTQAQVAARVGCSRVAVTKWESGRTENLRLQNLVALSKLYKLSTDQIITGDYGKSSSATRLETREPEKTPYAFAWPFELVSIERLQALNDREIGFVEGRLAAALDECEAARPAKQRAGNNG